MVDGLAWPARQSCSGVSPLAFGTSAVMPWDGAKMTPPATTLELMVEAPSVYSQSRLPEAGSTAVSPLLDCSTTTAAEFGSARHGMGLLQFAAFGRSSFQTLRPVRASMPTV